MKNENKKLIGRAERISLLDYGVENIPAKVDTGADISSIWASQVSEVNGKLSFVLFAKLSPYYNGKIIELSKQDYRLTRVANSFGDREERYVVKMRVRISERLVNASFTLADRSTKTYPILLGRRLLKNKFIVDVAKGTPLLAAEKAKRDKLQVETDVDED
jgi:hypothetical protein